MPKPLPTTTDPAVSFILGLKDNAECHAIARQLVRYSRVAHSIWITPKLVYRTLFRSDPGCTTERRGMSELYAELVARLFNYDGNLTDELVQTTDVLIRSIFAKTKAQDKILIYLSDALTQESKEYLKNRFQSEGRDVIVVIPVYENGLCTGIAAVV